MTTLFSLEERMGENRGSSPLGNTFNPWGQISPMGDNFTPEPNFASRSEVKNSPLCLSQEVDKQKIKFCIFGRGDQFND
jgi:hypothetical protein